MLYFIYDQIFKKIIKQILSSIFFNFLILMFVLLPWLRCCIWLIGYVAAVTANCCQHDNGFCQFYAWHALSFNLSVDKMAICRAFTSIILLLSDDRR
jgi:hypothetical protein